MPGRVNEYRIDLHGNDYAFLKGHRIMVQVQSTWFPLYDRNPQKFVPTFFSRRRVIIKAHLNAYIVLQGILRA